MDAYEISEAKGPQRRKKSSGKVWNILTIVVLVTLLCVMSFFILIFVDPNSSLNPFPPPTLNPADYTPTVTVTPKYTLIPSWTPTDVLIQATNTQIPSNTPVVTIKVVESPTSAPPLATGITGSFAFEVQLGSPSAIAGTDFHPDAGCNWMGVAGQATSLNGEAVKGLFVQLGGSMPGESIMDNLVMTGMAPQYGLGGFEFTLADKLIASEGTLWIQLLDQQNLPLSDRVYFNTYDDCQKNLVIIYFTQVR
jgi:heme/copper-type cytochrome/quinol oxidase subunit 2